MATTLVLVQRFSVRAFSSSSSSALSLRPHLSHYMARGHRHQPPSVSAASQIARGGALFSTDSENDREERVPATGWNHNPPKDPSFWNTSPNGAEGNQEFQQVRQQEARSEKVSRTGWLHNTKSKAELEKEQNQQESSSTSPSSSDGVPNKAQLRLQQAMKQAELNHRIVHPATFHSCGNGRRAVVTEHLLSLPIDRSNTERGAPRIDVAFTISEEIKDDTTLQFFQSLEALSPTQRASQYVQFANMENADDMIIYLQGGPGFGSPTPVVGLSLSGEGSWGAKALEKYKRIVLMDQRGTGKSTPITKQALEKRFPDLFLLDKEGINNSVDPEVRERFDKALEEATNYMALMRADNIVLDAEDIRESLMRPGEPGEEFPPRPWGAALGQSFGGFCMMTYLSQVERPPKVCLLTGGIAPMLTPVYDAYTLLWDRVKNRSYQYYEMYPGDVKVVKKIVSRLIDQPVSLPSGGTLTARRFLMLGMAMGGSPTSFASMHSLFNSAFLYDDDTEFTRTFLKEVDSQQPFDDNPLYYWMHETIYGDGPDNSPTNWAAHRALEDKYEKFPEFDYRHTSKLESDNEPVLFYGEMVFPWMAEDFAECSGVGCTALVNALAAKTDWKPLYDGEHMRRVLGDGTSVAAAASYYTDMYVDFDCSMKVAGIGGPLEKCKLYVTNDYQHSGLRDDGANMFSKIHGLATGSIRNL